MGGDSVIKILNVEHFDLEMESADKYVLVDFFATWCGPCNKIDPHIENLCKDYKEIKFLKVDVDKVPLLTKKYIIKSMPTFLLFTKTDNAVPTFTTIVGADLNKITNLLKSTRIVINDDVF